MRMFAVFIGIDRYKDVLIKSLNYAKADAVRFCKLVEYKIDPRDRKLWILLDEQATKVSIMRIIGEEVASQAGERDVVIVHFSGHGCPETFRNIDSMSRYLIAYDTEYENIFATGINMELEVKALFHRISSRLVVFFLDSCFSGRAGGRTFEGPNIRRTLGYRGTVQLEKLNLGEGRIIIAACDDNQVAQEDPAMGQGVFTYYLLEVLTDRNLSGNTISIGQIYDQVYLKVQAHTNGKQTPILNGRYRFAQIPKLV